MLKHWKTSVMVPIYKGKGDVTNCGAYRVKLLEHGMKSIERVLKKKIRGLVEAHDMQFSFMPKRGTTDALFVVKRMQEKYRRRIKNCSCVSWI